MIRLRLLACVLGLIAATFVFALFAGNSPDRAQAQYSGWEIVRLSTDSDIEWTSTFLLNKNSAWIGGKTAGHGLIYNLSRANDAWLLSIPIAVPNPVNDVVATSSDKVWIVGDNGLFMRNHPNDLQGQVWLQESAPIPADANLTTIQMFGEGEEGWIGGYIPSAQGEPPSSKPVLLHYKNGQWTLDTSIQGEGSILSLHFVGKVGWAVGSSIWRYDGTTWSEEATPAFCPDTLCFGGYNGVRAISDDEAWAVGSRTGTCAICQPRAYMIHRIGGTWRWFYPDEPTMHSPDTEPYVPTYFSDVTFTSPQSGMVVGGFDNRTNHGVDRRPLVWSYNRNWLFDVLNLQYPYEPMTDTLNSISSLTVTERSDYGDYEATYTIVVGTHGLIMAYGYPSNVPLPEPTQPPPAGAPTNRVENPNDPNVLYFYETGHKLQGGFRQYWEAHGGLNQFGYPITEEYQETAADGKSYTTQWFERARFEFHPENRPPYDVLLGLLGREVTKGRENEPAFLPVPSNTQVGVLYYPQTGHSIAREFYEYWLTHGGLPTYGYPITQPFMETSKTDGRPHLVQYFERNRLEYHPENAPEYQVQLGLLGVDLLKARGWLP